MNFKSLSSHVYVIYLLKISEESWPKNGFGCRPTSLSQYARKKCLKIVKLIDLTDGLISFILFVFLNRYRTKQI